MSASGLGLSEDRFWALTPRELWALREIWMDQIERQNYIHASIQATLYNAHFDAKGVPWTAEDLLGRGDREKRRADRLKDRVAGFMMAGKTDETKLPDFILELAANRKLVN